jgi:hypothetical protein
MIFKKETATEFEKQVCITAPSWEPEFEHHVRDID